MKRIMSLLVVLVFAASCGGGGGNSGSALQETDRLAGNQFTVAYRTANPNQEYEDDEVLYEDEIDCSDPVFTTREPLPEIELIDFGGFIVSIGLTDFSGFIVQERISDALVTRGNTYWECDESIEYYHADGTTRGVYTDDYEDIQDFRNVCGIGTRPPNFTGIWNVVTLQTNQRNINLICGSIDILPGIVFCSDVTVSQDGLAYTTGASGKAIAIHGGVVLLFEMESQTCYLREG